MSVQVWLAVAETTLDILVLVVKPLVSNLWTYSDQGKMKISVHVTTVVRILSTSAMF